MSAKEEEKKLIVPKAPKKQKNTAIPKAISYLHLIEVDDDSDSSQNERVSISPKKKEKCHNGYLSDDRYEDSFDEEFGEGCETNPDSGNVKVIMEKE